MSYFDDSFIPDDVVFIRVAPTPVLAAAARAELDLNRVACEELIRRGCDKNGVWVGSSEARKIHTQS